ncbi:hypothetical protein H8S95_06210 [Pontibacter sp. KCTC 32443]|uniref:hypothetical protein n=1 Tax=Pontibacter TaxID=323449 RepID=UPI00164D7420|nr:MULTISPECIES: hypothetical protein [Pontibacter]MBC5773649.1 hypothetical protein [Pontibacter sp. KCTC 32443]
MHRHPTIVTTNFRKGYVRPELKWLLVVISILLSLASCRPPLATTSPRYLPDGKYKIKQEGKVREATVINHNDTAFLLLDDRQTLIPAAKYLDANIKSAFVNKAFGFNVITVPFKFRPPQDDVPQQLNTSFNAALAAGFRSDRYTYKKVTLAPGLQRRERFHSGYGVGLFLGAGTVLVRSAFINNALPHDYDGMVVYYGGSIVLGLGRFNTGIALGFDLLADKYKDLWIYQNKPWIGAVLGVKL